MGGRRGRRPSYIMMISNGLSHIILDSKILSKFLKSILVLTFAIMKKNKSFFLQWNYSRLGYENDNKIKIKVYRFLNHWGTITSKYGQSQWGHLCHFFFLIVLNYCPDIAGFIDKSMHILIDFMKRKLTAGQKGFFLNLIKINERLIYKYPMGKMKV